MWFPLRLCAEPQGHLSPRLRNILPRPQVAGLVPVSMQLGSQSTCGVRLRNNASYSDGGSFINDAHKETRPYRGAVLTCRGHSTPQPSRPPTIKAEAVALGGNESENQNIE